MVQLGFNLTCLGPSAFMSNIEAPWATLTEARVSGLNEGQAWVRSFIADAMRVRALLLNDLALAFFL